MVDAQVSINDMRRVVGERELRLALVCYGGVSLAVYMHGVTKELHKLVLASAAYDEPANPFPSFRSEHVYWDLLHRIEKGEVGQSRGVNTRIVVDVISGTSAGGINGICLAKAIALNRPQDALRTLWFDRGDISQLAAAPKPLPLWIKAPLLLAKSTFSKQTPLRGDDMCRWLFSAFEAMDRAQSVYPGPVSLLPPGHTLDLFVTTTDFQGYPRQLPIYDPRMITDIAHRHVLEFRHEHPAKTDFGPQANHVLAFAARATSSFPGAFPPITFASYEACFKPNSPQLATLAARQFEAYAVSGVDPARSCFVDGGVLNNYPFALAIRAIKAKPAEREVVRRLLYIEPDPVPSNRLAPSAAAAESDNAEANVPSWLSTIWAGLSTIPASQPVIDDLNQLAERNRIVRRIRDIIENSFDGIREQVTAARSKVGLLASPDDAVTQGPKLLTVRVAIDGLAQAEAGFAYATYRRLRLRVVLKRYAAMIADSLSLLEDSYPARFIEVVASDWAGQKRLLKQIESEVPITEDANGQNAFLRDLDLDYHARRVEFVIAGINWWYRDIVEPGMPARAELDAVKARLYQYLAELDAGVVKIANDDARDALARAFDREAVLTAAREQDRGYAVRNEGALDELRQIVGKGVRRLVEQLEAPLYNDLMGRAGKWPEKMVKDVLARYLGFPFWDILVFPIQALHDVNERDHTEVIRISPYDSILLERDGTRKLKGTGFHHFAAFFDREFRESDYLWGRLDAAERIVGLLLDDANRPGMSPDPRECRRVFSAILEEDQSNLKGVAELVRQLRTRSEELSR